MIEKVVIVGTGLIGASFGLALRASGFTGEIAGVDANPAEAAEAKRIGAVNRIVTPDAALAACAAADLVVLAVPVMAIMDWIGRLAPVLGAHTLVTDVGSTKLAIRDLAALRFAGPGRARFLPGHPMAGKEAGGAALSDAGLFAGAMWLFTPIQIPIQIPLGADPDETEAEFRALVARFGCRTLDLDAARHDRICAWVSHLPQMVSTAMSAMFEDEFAQEPGMADDFRLIGGRAMREMTRLGSSPFSMWRDVAQTNTANLAATIFALEQRLAHLRENLKTPELREEFRKANRFREERQTGNTEKA
jgi:prephenate dehydrogenase